MGLIGHNRGPAVTGAGGWHSHCWRSARQALLPTLPVEVVRLRVNRAKALGLPYKTYAGIRAQTGHDIVAFLFSSNGLQVTQLAPEMPVEVVAKLADLQALRIGLATAPLLPETLAQAPCLDLTHAAPYALGSFRQIAERLRDACGKTPADRVVLIGSGTLERDWCAAGRLAGWIAADHYFSA